MEEEEDEPASEQPSVDEVCEQLQLNDVEIEFTDSHYQSLATYKSFTQFVKPILQKENAKAPSSKLMMLIAAKWREFSEENPNLQDDEPEADKSEEEEEEVELEYQPKPSRSRRGAEKQEEPEESEEEDTKKKKKSAGRASTSGKRGRKQKVVPTLKIKFGKKKDQSSDEEKASFFTTFSIF